jgi:triosephosphate isomerase (TIM)
MSTTLISAAPLTSRSRLLVMGNWKMNGSLAVNESLLADLMTAAHHIERTELAVCPPFPYLSSVAQQLANHSIGLGAQDVSAHEKGAFTGEVSAPMLREFGCRWVIVGHSERRALHAESDELVAQKALAVLKSAMTPVVCVGESLQERDADQVEQVIERQLAPIFALGETAVARMVIAYEPVWAIGTGRTATPEQAQAVHAFIRQSLPAGAKDIPLLYGGSVKPDNASALFAMADIDGGLIGGAALVAADFLAIARA